jgi:hypothetical protein
MAKDRDRIARTRAQVGGRSIANVSRPVVVWFGTAAFIAGRFFKRSAEQGARQ